MKTLNYLSSLTLLAAATPTLRADYPVASHCYLAAPTSLVTKDRVCIYCSDDDGSIKRVLYTTNVAALAAETRTFDAEDGHLFGGADRVGDETVSGHQMVRLSATGQGVSFNSVPASSKLAIRYASTNVGIISVVVNDQPARKVNVHSSGSFTLSFLNAILDLAIPAKATLTISVATNDVAVNIDRIIVGDGDLGLPPDIWNLPPLPGIRNQRLATGCRVLRITHDKGLFNDDDPGATHPGWMRRCNLRTGDFNDDLTTSDTPGDVWSGSFTGTGIQVIAPKEPGAGKIEIQIDGETRATADLSSADGRQGQQTVCEVIGLPPGKHFVHIINRGPGSVAVDALIVR